MLAADLAFLAALAVMIGANLYFAPKVGGRIAMQWGFDGKPTWYAPKRVAMWGMVALALMVRLLIYFAMTYTPERVHGPEIGLLLASIIIAAVHIGILAVAARKP
ncbi:DUF1648 domain-containing protein [Rhodoplanes sp. Z2-YC6860]|uniref:DUF1648 domain-containing protein n=1 Tax=Rhodoplanes sp. Z2-YC6860 TaxID=674703 RepID=UPI00078CE084|nr:DUF1648 domain-containing protein [Rhodoplanes sp. Z2-YC6860]AMN42683.1 hypothetical protein RHPLAN_42530 [Rhodoplanes sp. Z2-YC6860]